MDDRTKRSKPNTKVVKRVYFYSESDVQTGWKEAPIGEAKIKEHCSSIVVVSWNVHWTPDGHVPSRAGIRLSCILDHLENEVFGCDADEEPRTCCILLQDVGHDAVPTLLENPWVRKYFFVTPISEEQWPNRWEGPIGRGYLRPGNYSNITLISRSIPVVGVSSLLFHNSHEGHSALVTDVQLAVPADGNGTTKPQLVTLRLANTHLERTSAYTESRVSQAQMKSTAQALKDKKVQFGILCGDMEAVPEKDPIMKETGLIDAWKVTNADPFGFTWGYQKSRKHNGSPSRRNKIFYTAASADATLGIMVKIPNKIGVGLMTPDGKWASEHYGLKTSIRITDDV